MATRSSQISTPKLCPRCGAFYQDLPSKTCPQCFAILEVVTGSDAEALIAEQEARSKDPAYIESRQSEDEEFKEQSFRGCFNVVIIGIAVVVVCAILIIVGSHVYSQKVQDLATKPVQTITRSGEILTPNIDQILPLELASANRISVDSDYVLPGTLTHVDHGIYSNGVQLYAVPSEGLTDDEASALNLAVNFAATQHHPGLFHTGYYSQAYHYEILAPTNELSREAVTDLL